MWWVFNDIANIKTETFSDTIGLEIRAQAFAFTSPNPHISNSTFYKYQIINRSSNVINQCRIGQFVDVDLGNAADDYLGCDVGRGLAFGYNADSMDNGSEGYGLNPPAVGTDFLQGPLADGDDGIDNNMNGTTDEPGEECTMSKFVYWGGGGSGSVMYWPSATDDYYQYLSGLRSDGLSITFGGNGYTNQSNPPCSFMFPGTTDPAFPANDWTMATGGLVPTDIRYTQSLGPFTFDPGEIVYITVGTVWARDSSGPISSLNALKAADDEVQLAFNNCFATVGIPETTSVTNVNCFPNPFSDHTTISFQNPKQQQVSLILYDLKGNRITHTTSTNKNQFTFSKGKLDTGLYLYSLTSENKIIYSGKMVVQ